MLLRYWQDIRKGMDNSATKIENDNQYLFKETGY